MLLTEENTYVICAECGEPIYEGPNGEWTGDGPAWNCNGKPHIPVTVLISDD